MLRVCRLLLSNTLLPSQSLKQLSVTSTHPIKHLHKGRTIWYLGGPRFFVACKRFFYLRWKTSFLLGDERPTIFLCSVEEFFVVCFPYYVRYHLVFFWSAYFSSNSTTIFFSAYIFTNFFFWLLWRQTIFFNFILGPPPPDIKSCVPKCKIHHYITLFVRPLHSKPGMES